MTSGIDIERSLNTQGGDVAGGNIFKIILNIAQQQMGKDDPRSSELRNHFNVLTTLIIALKSWKEVHNSLDEIRSRFDQFNERVEHAHIKRQPIPFDTLRHAWRPVKGIVDSYNECLSEALQTEPSFNSIHPQHQLIGRKGDVSTWHLKSLALIDLCDDLNRHLWFSREPSPLFVFNETQLELILLEVRWKFGHSHPWWRILYELSDDIDSKLTENMYLADKILRSTAERLCQMIEE